MKLTSKFGLRSEQPMPGGLSGHWLTLQPTEIATAYAAGSGAGTPDDNGTLQPGTIVGGMVVTPGTAGTYDLMSSPLLNAAQPQVPYVVFEGDDDFSGIEAGVVIGVHGPGRFDTDVFDTTSLAGYTQGASLCVLNGKLVPKVAADHKQIVAWVGPRGLQNGVLDVIAPQGVVGYVD